MGFKQFMAETGITRVRQMMSRSVPIVNTIGIVTANNPRGQAPLPTSTDRQNRQENDRLNTQLRDDLRCRQYQPIDCSGKTGDWERSLLVPNIRRDDLCALGRKYDQRAVIWGHRSVDDQGYPFFRFQYIQGDQTKSIRDVKIGNEANPGRDDVFTLLKRGRLEIPFFHDKTKAPLSRAAVPAIPTQQMQAVEGFFLPFFDDPDAELDVPWFSE